MIEQKAYRDTWGRGLDSYLQWFYETAILLRELLSEEGMLYVHCDSGVNGHIRLILDEVFGSNNFINEIVWKRFNFHADANRFGRITDRVLFYSCSDNFNFKRYDAERQKGA